MSQIDVVNIKGEKVDTIELNDSIFNIEPNTDVMYRYVRYQLAKRRAGLANAKTRGEVAGGGRKPYRQKHTGRARAGSTRSPLWRHGGVTHGPKPRDFSFKLNKKMKKLALKSTLSDKFREGNLLVVDEIKLDEPKTKKVVEIKGTLNLDSALVLLPEVDDKHFNVKLAARNVKDLKVIIADNPNNVSEKVTIDGVNVFDMLKYSKLVLTVDMVKKIEEVLA
jgi:large subunit ribosomal protein L4